MLRLLEQVPETEHGLPVHLVVGCLPRVPDPAHALLPVSGYDAFFACLFHLAVVRALNERRGLGGGGRIPYFIRCLNPYQRWKAPGPCFLHHCICVFWLLLGSVLFSDKVHEAFDKVLMKSQGDLGVFGCRKFKTKFRQTRDQSYIALSKDQVEEF